MNLAFTQNCRTVCVCVFSSHSFWTSSSLDVPAEVTQEEGHTGFLIHLLSAVRALIFLARRIQPFLSLVDREVEFCVLTIFNRSPPVGIFILFLKYQVLIYIILRHPTRLLVHKTHLDYSVVSSVFKAIIDNPLCIKADYPIMHATRNDVEKRRKLLKCY